MKIKLRSLSNLFLIHPGTKQVTTFMNGSLSHWFAQKR